ncbi:hypothetical protein EV426DRAFT_578247 [Tirmania nivea]|nr:hypothetical protein EV426DRAFT_578247 [Tirmania nivea]
MSNTAVPDKYIRLSLSMDPRSPQALPVWAPSSRQDSKTVNTTSQTRPPKHNLVTDNPCTSQSSSNCISPIDMTDFKSTSSFSRPKVDDGQDDIQAAKRRRVMRSTSPVREEKVGAGGTEIDSSVQSPAASTGTPDNINHSIRRMPQQALPLRTLFRGGGDESQSTTQRRLDGPDKHTRQRAKTLNILTMSTFCPDSGQYCCSDSEDAIPRRFPKKFSRLARNTHECEPERERDGGYEADVEDEGAAGFSESRGMIGRHESSDDDDDDDDEEEGTEDCGEDVDMQME